MEWYIYLAVIGVGMVAGFVNTMAGSGSLLTLPLLMFLGLPANVANGTNRIAIFLQNVIGVGSFRQQKILNLKEGLWISLPAIIGSLVGARIAVHFNEEIMERTIAGLLLFMFFIIIFKPDRWLKEDGANYSTKPTVIKMVIFFLIGIYGGFIQAGVGFFLLAGLVLGVGADLIKANALKLFIILLYTPFALAIFMIHGQVDYKLGLILAAGNMIGCFIGTRVAVSWGPRFVRIILLAALFFSSLELLGVFDFLFR